MVGDARELLQRVLLLRQGALFAVAHFVEPQDELLAACVDRVRQSAGVTVSLVMVAVDVLCDTSTATVADLARRGLCYGFDPVAADCKRVTD